MSANPKQFDGNFILNNRRKENSHNYNRDFASKLRREKKKNENFGGNYAKMKVRVLPTNAICTENRVTNKWLQLHGGKIFSSVKFRKKTRRRKKNSGL